MKHSGIQLSPKNIEVGTVFTNGFSYWKVLSINYGEPPHRLGSVSYKLVVSSTDPNPVVKKFNTVNWTPDSMQSFSTLYIVNAKPEDKISAVIKKIKCMEAVRQQKGYAF